MINLCDGTTAVSAEVGSGDRPDREESMPDRRDHAAWAGAAVAVFQSHHRRSDEHAIADLICDLGHLAEQQGLDFLDEVRRGVGRWYAERQSE
jgi:hypothetical protein